METYAGTYTAAGYSDITISWKEGALWASYYGQQWRLEHYHYDVFQVDMLERYDAKDTVSFRLDNQGLISSLQISIEPAIGDMTFSRKPLKIDAETKAQLIGTYDYPLAGQDAEVLVKDNILYLALTGQDKQALHCVKQSSDKTTGTFRFKFAGNAQSVVDFMVIDKACQSLVIKHPGVTYECSPNQ